MASNGVSNCVMYNVSSIEKKGDDQVNMQQQHCKDNVNKIHK